MVTYLKKKKTFKLAKIAVMTNGEIRFAYMLWEQRVTYMLQMDGTLFHATKFMAARNVKSSQNKGVVSASSKEDDGFTAVISTMNSNRSRMWKSRYFIK